MLEQAAFEIMHYWFGRVVASLDSGDSDNPLQAHAADNHFPENCIEGLGWRELLDMADDAQASVTNPTFIRLPDCSCPR
ncbi:hypothetical protein [Marinobacter sp. es.048]|uniref:hypothetical protein n=1 Tax=Marinobacter sp. es.048 TaxID=1761795 RepID=UPI000B591485|nr:hypothetical protein [Marinobacter sp. es.048]